MLGGLCSKEDLDSDKNMDEIGREVLWPQSFCWKPAVSIVDVISPDKYCHYYYHYPIEYYLNYSGAMYGGITYQGFGFSSLCLLNT